MEKKCLPTSCPPSLLLPSLCLSVYPVKMRGVCVCAYLHHPRPPSLHAHFTFSLLHPTLPYLTRNKRHVLLSLLSPSLLPFHPPIQTRTHTINKNFSSCLHLHYIYFLRALHSSLFLLPCLSSPSLPPSLLPTFVRLFYSNQSKIIKT